MTVSPRHLPRRALPAAALLLAATGCSVNPPLMFADSVDIGLQLGTSVAGSGGAVSLGYKARSVAVVPVSVLDDQGRSQMIRGHADGAAESSADALSVFAVFESRGKSNSLLRNGQVFATGVAAQHLTRGQACAVGEAALCAPVAPAAARSPSVAAVAPPTPPATDASAAPSQAAPAPGGRPYQHPLVYVRTDVVGLDIGGSQAEQGLSFSFGYASRNLALVPVVTVGAGDVVQGLKAEDGRQGALSRDAFSVMGQFAGSTALTDLDYGLERYFSTGVAARNLSRGVGAAQMAKAAKAAASR